MFQIWTTIVMAIWTTKSKTLFSTRPSDSAKMLHACADRDENGSHLKKIPPHFNRNPFLSKAAGRPSEAGRCGHISYASLRFAIWGSVTLSTSTHRHYDERVHRIKQLTRGHNTIPYHIYTTTLVTFETRLLET